MAELDYAGCLDALEAILKADPRLAGVHVTQELDFPTSFPWVRLDLTSADRTPVQMVGFVSAGQPDWVVVDYQAVVWTMSAQSAQDAAHQRDALVSTIVDVLRASPNNYTLGNRVAWIQVARIAFSRGIREGDQSAENAGIYANATLTLQARALA